MEDCVFCKIGSYELFKDLEYQSDEVVAFDDMAPVAPTHVLIIPRRHIASVEAVQKGDEMILGEMIMAAKEVAAKRGISEDGYKLLIRTGHHGGQEVPHLHLHLIGGAELHEEIRVK